MNKRLHIFQYCLLLMILLVAMSGCAYGDKENRDEQELSGETTILLDAELTQSPEAEELPGMHMTSYTLQEAKDRGDVYFRKGDEYFAWGNEHTPGSWNDKYVGMTNTGYVESITWCRGFQAGYYDTYIADWDGNVSNLPHIDLTYMDVVTTIGGVSTYDFRRVTVAGYTCPWLYMNYTSMSGYTSAFMVQELDMTCNLDLYWGVQIDEIDGVEGVTLGDWSSVLHEKGIKRQTHYKSVGGISNPAYYLFVADTPTSIEIGHYMGVEYDSDTVWVDKAIVRVDETITVAPERTKDGYFKIDVSSLPDGIYMFKNNLYYITGGRHDN